MWTEDDKYKFEKMICDLSIINIIQYRDDPISTHYHFKKRKDMKKSMQYNMNPWDTFSYQSKKIPVNLTCDEWREILQSW